MEEINSDDEFATAESGPTLSQKSTLDENILQFDYSFGYDCRRYYNLLVLDEKTLLFFSGNLLHFFNVDSGQLHFRRSVFGSGIGCIAKNPNLDFCHFAVGENGASPTIFIYEWPSLTTVKLFKNAAENSIISLSYSSDGTLLASYSGKPNYVMTVYDWFSSKLLMRSFSNAPIHKLIFSSYSNIHLTSFGDDHIKFWRILNTFTGIKLEAKEGKFDKTQISEILCAYHMPDDTIVSGCAWGNILVWKDDYISFEITRKLKKKCHEGPITQFMYENNELWSVGLNGRIKIWFYKSIDGKNVPEDNRVVDVEPTFVFHMPEIMFMGIYKTNNDPNSTSYYAQDGNGGLWCIDLNTTSNPHPPLQLYKCHGGAVVDIATCPWSSYLASLGVDGRLQLYQYATKKLLYFRCYPAKGTCLLWLSLNVQASGNQLIMGFDDGNLRVVVLNLSEDPDKISSATIQIIKPHTRPVTKLAVNENKKVLVSGSADCSIFIHMLQCAQSECVILVPIGFITLPGVINCLQWHPQYDSVVMDCVGGHCSQVEPPAEPQPHTADSFRLNVTPQKCNLFTTKTVTNSILWILFLNSGKLWFSMDGNDAGCIYEHDVNQQRDAESIWRFSMEINHCLLNRKQTHMFLAMCDGCILVIKINQDNWKDLSDNWKLSMHDNANGFISRLCFSHDETYFFTCGHDGNIFSYKSNFAQATATISARPYNQTLAEVEDVNGYKNLSLEEAKIQIQNDTKSKREGLNTATLIARLRVLKESFDNVLIKNSKLPLSQIIPKQELELHPLITEYFDQQRQASLELVKAELAYDVEQSRVAMEKCKNHFTDPLDVFPITVKSIQKGIVIKTIRQRKLTQKFYDVLKTVEEKITQEDLIVKWEEQIKISNEAPTVPYTIGVQKKTKCKEDVLFNLSTQDLKFGPKINQLLNRYKYRKLKLEKRRKEWEAFGAIKPLRINCIEDQAALNRAIETIGDYKWKSDQNYHVPRHHYASVAKKYHQLLLARLQQFKILHEFNVKVYQLRAKRVKVLEHLHILDDGLKSVQEELNDDHRKVSPNIPKMTDEDFPERNLDVIVGVAEATMSNVKIIEASKGDMLEKEVLEQMHLEVEEDTEWEAEARMYRQSRKLFEQDIFLKKIKSVIKKFDDEVDTLAEESYKTIRDADLLDLHLITLNQELIVLKEFETPEKNLREKMHMEIKKLYDIEQQTKTNRETIEQHLEMIHDLFNDSKNVKNRFLSTIADNTHFNYLNQVFKGNTTSLFDTSEGSSDEGILKDDDVDVCPENCDQALFEMALKMRTERLKIHEEILLLKNGVDGINTEIRNDYKLGKSVENEIKMLQDHFGLLQTQKQAKLNQLMCAIILKLDQLQHLNSNNVGSKIGDTLIFPRTTLTNLYKRVGQLHNDTLVEETKHREYSTHLSRMKTDCHQMKENIKQLQKQIEDNIKNKIGEVVKVELIEETRLKKILHEFKLSQADVKTLYQHELAQWKVNTESKEVELKKVINENTSRLNALAEIKREKTELMQTLGRQSAKQKHLENVVTVAEQCRDNIEKLSIIVKNQNQEKEKLQEEIKRLSFKTIPAVTRKISDEIFNLNLEHLETEEATHETYQWKLYDHKEKHDDVDFLPMQQSFTTEVQIPSVFSDDAEEMIKYLILEMLESLRSFPDVSKRSVKNLVEQILPNILEQTNVDGIIENLADFLPKAFSYQQHRVVEVAAQQIHTLRHPQLSHSEDIWKSAKKLLGDLINEAIVNWKGEENVEEMLLKFTQHLPMQFLTQQNTVDTILTNLRDVFDSEESLIEAVLNVSTESLDELQELLDGIINTLCKLNISLFNVKTVPKHSSV